MLYSQEFTAFSTSNGLPDNRVNCFLQDSYGIIWLGTGTGLVRFDGTFFTSVKPHPADSSGLPEDVIISLFAPSRDQLLISTISGKLVLYSYSTGRFTNLSLVPSIGNIRWDKGRRLKSGEICYATREGIAFLKNDFTSAYEVPMAFPGIQKKQSYSVNDLAEDRNGNILLATFTQQVVLYNRKKKLFSKPYYPQFPLYQVREFIYSSDSTKVYAATAGRGLLTIDLKTGLAKETVPVCQTGLQVYHIISVAEHTPGQLSLATPDGLVIYSTESRTAWLHSASPFEKGKLKENNLTGTFLSRDNLLWVSSPSGLHRVNFRRKTFALFSEYPGNASVTTQLTHGQFALQLDSKYILFGHGNGLSVYDSKNSKHNQPVDQKLKEFLKRNNPFAAIKDGNTLWLGTWGGGLIRLNIIHSENTVLLQSPVYFRHSTTDTINAFSDYIKHLSLDTQGNLYISTWGDGLFTIRAADKFTNNIKIKRIIPKDNSKAQLTSHINFCYADRFGRLWINSGDNILYSDSSQLYFEEIIHTNVNIRKATKILLGSKNVGSDSILIGSPDCLLRLIILDRNTYSLEKVDNSPTGSVFQILSLQSGQIWYLTERGYLHLYEGSKQTSAKINLNTEVDGFTASWGVGANLGDTMLIFSGMQGFVSFNPNKIINTVSAEKTFITYVSVNDSGKYLGTDALLINRLDFTHDNSGATFRFSVMDFETPHRRQYRYRLLGSGEQWSNAVTNPEVVYPRFAPGEYVFQVMASGTEGEWTGEISSVSISVSPPFYNRIWFRALIFFSVIGVLIFYGKYKLSLIRLEQERQQEFSRQLIDAQETERSAIAKELHDSLGQNLLVIKNILGLYKRKISKEDQDLQTLDTLTSQSIEEVRNISSSLFPHQLARFGLVPALRNMIEKVSNASGLKSHFTASPETFNPGPKTGITIYRITQEALNNIVKHSGASEITVTLRVTTQAAELSIIDNGKGLPSVTGTGSGMYNMKERAAVCNGQLSFTSSENNGTTVHLLLPGDTLEI